MGQPSTLATEPTPTATRGRRTLRLVAFVLAIVALTAAAAALPILLLG